MRFGSIIAAAAVVLAAPAAGAQSYQFTSYSAPGSYNTYFTGVNDAGQIVGQTDAGSSFVYAGGTLTPIQAVAGFAAQEINNSGVVVGSDPTYGYIVSAGVVQRLDAVGPNSGAIRPFTSASGINDAGAVVGSFSDTRTFPNYSHGYVYRAGVFTSFDVPFGSGFTDAYAINNLGQIVGQYSGNDVNASPHGYLRDAAGTFTQIDAPGAISTSLTGINDAGDIIGRAAYRDPASGSGYADSAFVVRGGVYTMLGFGATDDFFPLRINNAGQIVGYYRDGTSSYSPYVGFVATPLASTVPEPATLALTAAGCAVVGAGARRRARRRIVV